MRRNRFLFAILFASFSMQLKAADVSGKIIVTDEWRPVVYLSVIDSFDKLNTASIDFVLAESEIRDDGSFTFKNITLPVQDLLFRLHVCKKDDPVSSIIIGGKDENFIHFLMNDTTSITIDASKGPGIFSIDKLNGYPANKELGIIIHLARKINGPLKSRTFKSREMHRSNVLEELVQYTEDESANPLVRLFAAHIVSDQFSATDHLDTFQKMAADLNELNLNSPYYYSFKEQLKYIEFQHEVTNEFPLKRSNTLRILALSFLVLITPLAVFFAIRKKVGSRKKSNGLLSLQERRVLDLLKKGKTNKEISSDLHISVSTVKSHVHRIYNKLGIRSRKELIQ